MSAESTALATTGSTQGNVVFQGDLTNSGTFAVSSNRTIVFGGTSAQRVAPLSYSNLIVNNAAGVSLDGPSSVSRSLEMLIGNLRTGAYTLTLGPAGILKENGFSSVVGKIASTHELAKGIQESFGDIGLLIQASGAAPGRTTVTRATGVSSALNDATAILRFFDVSPTVNSGLQAKLVFHYTDADLNGTNRENLTLFKSIDHGSTWTNVGGVVDVASKAITLSGIDSFSRWTAGEALPVLTVAGITPVGGETGTSLHISIAGTAFTPGRTFVGFSGTGITVDSLAVTLPTEIRARISIASNAVLGLRDVSVWNDKDERCTLRNAFEIRIRPNPIPRISTVTPSLVPRGQSVRILIQGGGFMDGLTSVAFGDGTMIDAISVISDSALSVQLEVALDAVLGVRNLRVTNPTPGGGTATMPAALTVVNPAPTLSGVEPATGERGTSFAVVLAGTNFLAGVTSVSFGDSVAVDSTKVLSSTRLRVRVSLPYEIPSGPRDISVTNPRPGGGTALLVGAFNIANPSPRIRCITPPVATRGRSACLTIDGTGFVKDVTAVGFDVGVSVDSIAVLSPTQIVANVHILRGMPPGANVLTVTNASPGGWSASSVCTFVVLNPPPSVLGITPGSGRLGQTQDVVVTGSDFFDDVSHVDLGSGIMSNSSSVDSSGMRITINVTICPETIVGVRNITITNAEPGGGSKTLEKAFTVQNPVPTLTSLSQFSGARGQTLDVMLTGTNFIAGTTDVSFGIGVAVDSAVVQSSFVIKASISIPLDAIIGARSVVVHNGAPGGGSATLPFVFNVGYGRPVISSVTPNLGARGETLNVVITGVNFSHPETSVSFGPGTSVSSGAAGDCSHIYVSLAIAVDARLGFRGLAVVNPLPCGGSATMQDAFSVQNPVPTLTGLTPSTGVRGQNLTVSLSGTNFLPGTTVVHFGAGVPLTSFRVLRLTEASADIIIPLTSGTGPRDVSVFNYAPGGGVATLQGGFTVVNPVPGVADVTPSRASAGTELIVRVTGSGFIEGVTSLGFGEQIIVTDLNVKNPTEFEARVAITPSAVTGCRNVVVTNIGPGGGSATLANVFVVDSSPATAVEAVLGAVPDRYVLYEAYPNPFNPSTRIRYGIPENSRVRLEVHNVLGNVVAELVNGERSKGLYELQWHPSNFPSGVYLYRIYAESLESTKKFIASRKGVLVK